MFGGAVYRLVELQFVRSGEFASYRERRINDIKQKAPRRGRILDADGNILAEDQPTQDLWIIPARVDRIDRRRAIVSNLPPLTTDQMVGLTNAMGEGREFEVNVARAALVDGNPLVAELSQRMGLAKDEVAGRLLAAIVAGRRGSRDDLTVARKAVEDIDFSLALTIRAARVNPYEDSMWKAVEVHTGGKRVYPAGKIFGHLTGTVGKLTAEEYEELRGKWDEEEAIPGKGVIMKQGRVFFSILADKIGPQMSEEEFIIRLQEYKRDGKIRKTQGYFENDIVGRGGLEQYYNQALRGRHRLQQRRLVWDKDRGGRRFEPKGEIERAVNGADVRISIRRDVQKKAIEIIERHMQEMPKRFPQLRNWNKSAAAILMDPNTGRIHALVSLPSYDPNTYSQDFAKLVADPSLPLMDRTINGIYPPGSVVKPLVGLAALSEDLVMPGQRFFCDRIMMLGGAKFTCLGRHGHMDLESALMHSCNMYFYHAGEALGGRRLYEWYTRFGLGHRTGVDISGESAGMLPRTAYTRRGWATGNTYHLAIGQGMAVTPLQIAVFYSALANAKGDVARIVRPHLLLPPRDPPRNAAEEELGRQAQLMDQPHAEVLVDKLALETVRQGMWEVVQGKPGTDQLGTGQLAAFHDGRGGHFFELAGKTGTAEWSKLEHGRVVKQTSHVWFAAYAPFDRPELVVVVFLPEAGIGGGSLCAPIAKDLIRMWFNLPADVRQDVVEEDALG